MNLKLDFINGDTKKCLAAMRCHSWQPCSSIWPTTLWTVSGSATCWGRGPTPP